jgi:hypothetical protein
MKPQVKQCAEIIKAIKEDTFYKEKKCLPENFLQLKEQQSIFEIEKSVSIAGDIEVPTRTGKDGHQLRIHLKKLQQAKQDQDLRKEYYTKLEKIENLYNTLLERKEKIHHGNLLNKVFDQAWQSIQREKEKLGAGSPFHDISENISHLLICIENYILQFQRTTRLIYQLGSLIQPFDIEDITTNSGLHKTLRQQAQTLMEEFRDGVFLNGGIDISVDVFSRRLEEFKEEILKKWKTASMAPSILNEKSAQYHEHHSSIDPKLLEEYQKASGEAIKWAGEKKIYAAVRALDSARIIGEIIDRHLQFKFYVERKLTTVSGKDSDNQFIAVLEAASVLIKDNKFSKADRLLNEISSKIAHRERTQFKELAKYIKLYENLRSLYIKHKLQLPGSPLARDIKQLREGIKKGDLLAVKNAEFTIIEKMTVLRIDNLEKILMVENDSISLSGTTIPFSAVVMEASDKKSRVISDKQGRFSFKDITLKEGENPFQLYDEYIYPFTGNKLNFSITRKVKKPYRNLKDLLTGVPLKDYPPEEIVRCKNKNCEYYFLKDTLKEYIEEHKNGCPNCHHDDFYSHKDPGFNKGA